MAKKEEKFKSDYPENAKEAIQSAITSLTEIKKEQPSDSISIVVLKRAILRMEVIRDNMC